MIKYLVVLLGGGAWHVNGGDIAVTGVAMSLLLGLFQANFRHPFQFFGHISYSLYLLHVPIGGRVINLCARFVHTMPAKCLVLMTALAFSTGAAWLLYRFVEQPAQQWSSAIRYGRKAITITEAPPAPVRSDPATP